MMKKLTLKKVKDKDSDDEETDSEKGKDKGGNDKGKGKDKDSDDEETDSEKVKDKDSDEEETDSESDSKKRKSKSNKKKRIGVEKRMKMVKENFVETCGKVKKLRIEMRFRPATNIQTKHVEKIFFTWLNCKDGIAEDIKSNPFPISEEIATTFFYDALVVMGYSFGTVSNSLKKG